jgi:hypothetical protein
MTKNLFLLFVVYFFVLQAGILGLLTGDTLYYKLGGINALAIILISIIYSLCTSSPSETTPKKEKKAEPFSPVHEKKDTPKEEGRGELISESKPAQEPLNEKIGIPKIVQAPVAPKKKRKKLSSGQWRIFLVTLLMAIAIHFIISEFFTYRSPLIAGGIGCIVFILIGKIFDIKGFSRVNTLFTTWIYYLLILLTLAYAGVYAAGKGELIETYVPSLRQISPIGNDAKDQKTDTLPGATSSLSSGDYVYEGTGELLSGSRQEQGNAVSGENFSGGLSTGNTGSSLSGTLITGTVTTGNVTTTGTVAPSTSSEVKNVTMIDAIKHVITANAIPLSTKTDISFSLVSKSNANYPYFKTAYEKRMIGKNTDPSKQISCETYMVIKGL